MKHQGEHSKGWAYVLGRHLIERRKLAVFIQDSIKKPKDKLSWKEN
jgi:hypothetical protein